ncbi:MAG TPA: hypothetical protein VNB94_09435, partial [Mycobacteriales bacterium]|nr:hypothetical protein [Mycobacteriales bacterium]
MRRLAYAAIVAGVALCASIAGSGTAYAATGDVCYAVGQNGLIRIDLTVDPPTEFAVGSFRTDVGGAAFQPGTDTLYAVSGGYLGTISLTTGEFNRVGLPAGSGTGADGLIQYAPLVGITFAQDGTLYALVERIANKGPDSNREAIILLDRSTGAAVPGAFNGVDYLLLERNDGEDITDIAVDPTTGVMYAMTLVNNGVKGDALLTVDLTTGELTTVGKTGTTGIGGLSFIGGQLYGTTNKTYKISKFTGVVEEVLTLGGPGVEGLACRTGATTTPQGRVVVDVDGDGVADPGDVGSGGQTVLLHRDADDDGRIDAVTGTPTPPIATTLTLPDGGYTFPAVTVGGAFIVELAATTLPAGHLITTPPQAFRASALAGSITTAPLLGHRPRPDVAVSLVGSPNPALVGSPVTYTATIVNAAGSGTATGGSLVFTLPSGATGAVPPGCVAGVAPDGATTWTCPLADLAPGASVTRSFVVTPAPVPGTATATVRATVPDETSLTDNGASAAVTVTDVLPPAARDLVTSVV